MHWFRRLKTGFSLWLIIAVLGHVGLSSWGSSARVLCVGADGHVAVESTDHYHPPASATDESFPPSEATFIQAQESACLDLPIVRADHGAYPSLNKVQKPSLDDGLAAIAVLLTIGFSLFPESVAEPAFPSEPSFADSRLAALRSVVLLN